MYWIGTRIKWKDESRNAYAYGDGWQETEKRVERIRVKDAVNPIWWLSKTDRPKADNRRVLKPYSASQRNLFKHGYNDGPRPSGWVVGDKFGIDHGGAIPPNIIEVANTR